MQARNVFQLFHIGCRADRPQEGSCSAHGLIGIQEIWMRARVGVVRGFQRQDFGCHNGLEANLLFCRARKILHFYHMYAAVLVLGIGGVSSCLLSGI